MDCIECQQRVNFQMATEKCLRQLPPIRCDDRLEAHLMRLAAAEDRKLSDYIRRVLERHCFGHAGSLAIGVDSGNESSAQQGIAR